MFTAFLSWRRQRSAFIKLGGKKRFDSSSEHIWGSQTLRVPARPPPQQLGCDDVTQHRRWAQRPEGLTLLSSPASPSPALAISYGSPLPATAAPRCGSEPLICPSQPLLCTCCLSSSPQPPSAVSRTSKSARVYLLLSLGGLFTLQIHLKLVC